MTGTTPDLPPVREAAPDGPLRTALHGVHEALGASFTDFGGWDMPLRYASDLAEHHAVRRSAGIFDLSHMGEVKVTGTQAAAALDHALVGTISKVGLGRARYTMIVAEDGGILDDLIVYHVGEEEYLVVPNAGNRERVAAALAERCADFDCTVEEISLRTSLIAVQGPRAEEILRGVVESGAAIPAALRPVEGEHKETDEGCGPDVLCGEGILARLRYYAAVRATAAGHAILLARTGYTGEDGFELFCGSEDAEDLWQVITAHAASLPPTPPQDGDSADAGELPALTPCGLASRDSLRLEAGMPLYGHELTEGITPFDASLGAVVKLDKPEFVGRDSLAERADRDGEPGTRVLVALAGEGRRAARAGSPVLITEPDGTTREVGTVTSGLLSPTLGHPIALALLEPFTREETAWPAGTVLAADVRGRQLPMSVVDAPFYKRAR